jgi:hypothetical protein
LRPHRAQDGSAAGNDLAPGASNLFVRAARGSGPSAARRRRGCNDQEMDMDMDTDDLNNLLKNELSATETYRQALDKNRSEYGSDAKFQQLSQMLRGHEESAAKLRELVRQEGGTPSTDSGAWGTWSKTVMGTAKLFGDNAALKALKEGEESGIKDYRDVIDDDDTTPMVKDTLRAGMARNQSHVRELDRLMAAT